MDGWGDAGQILTIWLELHSRKDTPGLTNGMPLLA